MTATMILNGLEELPRLHAAVVADIDRVDFGGLLEQELMRMADLHKRYFDTSTGPDGKAWKRNAPSTIKQKGHSVVLRGIRGKPESNVKASKNRPRVRFSKARNIAGFRLATSLTAKTTLSYGDAIREAISEQPGTAVLAFGTAVEYSIYNQFGTSRIPARPHLGFNSQYLKGMVERAADHCIAQLKKSA